MKMKRLVLIADDYGISPAVSAGIRELASLGRISGTGAMTLMPSWQTEAKALAEIASGVEVGLHFTLTDQAPLGHMPVLAPGGHLPPVGTLLKRSLTGAIPRIEIEDELNRQMDAFERHLGRAPDFIDGHQHVHVFKGVREAVLAAFDGRLDRKRCWLRDCSDRPAALLARGHAAKAGLIAWLSAPVGRAARARGIATNSGFSGFYDGNVSAIGDVFPRMLVKAGDGHLLMMHPGHVDQALRDVDSLIAPRQAEWTFLQGDAFPVCLESLGFALTLGRESWQTPPP